MSDRARIEALRAAFPEAGLFRDKEWRVSPQAFALEPEIVTLIAQLGPALRRFQRACNALYFAGGELAWVAALLDQGKPREIIELGREARWRNDLPGVLRPDLVLTETGVSITELDSLPGGMGLTGWLNETYAALGDAVLGGADGMRRGFDAAFPGADVLISAESGDYEPEMHWLTGPLGRRVWRTRDARPETWSSAACYRFFELFDLGNVEHAAGWLQSAVSGTVRFTPPLKAFLEEKLWLVLFWVPQLETWWREQLGEDDFALLRRCIPQGWLMDPAPLPAWAVRPGLDVNSWDEVRRFGRRQRELVLKISGFSELGWGSRSVEIGHDLSQDGWSQALDQALADWPQHPWIMQRFHTARVLPHPRWDDASGLALDMASRVRLCPYYFVPDGTEETQLGGVLATVCPSDKKILHGMKDAMMLPCVAA